MILQTRRVLSRVPARQFRPPSADKPTDLPPGEAVHFNDAVPADTRSDRQDSSVLRLDVQTPGVRPDVVVIRMSGVLVGAAARPARAAMVRALATSPGEVVADLSGVTAADSSGAVLLVAMRRHARRLGSSLRLVGVGIAVRRAVQNRGVGFLLTEEPGVHLAVGVPASAR
jgi:anti-anti-sigma factor